MATEHLKTDPEYKPQGLDLSVLKLKLYNWLAIEVGKGEDIDSNVPQIGMTTREKMQLKADQLGDIIDGYVKGSIVYVDKSEESETAYTVPTDSEQSAAIDQSPELLIHSSNNQEELVIARNEEVGGNGRIVTRKWNLRLK